MRQQDAAAVKAGEYASKSADQVRTEAIIDGSSYTGSAYDQIGFRQVFSSGPFGLDLHYSLAGIGVKQAWQRLTPAVPFATIGRTEAIEPCRDPECRMKTNTVTTQRLALVQ